MPGRKRESRNCWRYLWRNDCAEDGRIGSICAKANPLHAPQDDWLTNLALVRAGGKRREIETADGALANDLYRVMAMNRFPLTRLSLRPRHAFTRWLADRIMRAGDVPGEEIAWRGIG